MRKLLILWLAAIALGACATQQSPQVVRETVIVVATPTLANTNVPTVPTAVDATPTLAPTAIATVEPSPTIEPTAVPDTSLCNPVDVKSTEEYIGGSEVLYKTHMVWPAGDNVVIKGTDKSSYDFIPGFNKVVTFISVFTKQRPDGLPGKEPNTRTLFDLSDLKGWTCPDENTANVLRDQLSEQAKGPRTVVNYLWPKELIALMPDNTIQDSTGTVNITRQVVVSGTEAAGLFIRKDPKTQYEPIGKAKEGQILNVLMEQGDWILVEVPETGKQGWVSKAFTKPVQ